MLCFVALLAGNALWTLRFFDLLDDPRKLLEPTPILSGKHALHCYHGQLGAQAWLEHQVSSCFDPSYQAGYPKSPVFDSGCRPAELFYLPAQKHSYVSYKVGLFISCLLIPIFFISMARGLELSPVSWLLAGFFGMILWWSKLNTEQLITGELDLLLGGISAIIHCCWLIRYAHQPSLLGWCIITFSACVAWYIQPVFFAVFIPPIALHYLWNAFKHSPMWHLSLYLAWGLALGVNAPWLREWLHYLGLMLPIMDEPLTSAGWKNLWQDWRDFVPRDPLMLLLSIGGLIGIPFFAYRHTSASIIMILTAVCVSAASHLHRFWPMLEELHLFRLLHVVVWFAVFPVVHMLEGLSRLLSRKLDAAWAGAAWLAILIAGTVFVLEIPMNWNSLPKLKVGFSESQISLIQKLQFQKPTARVLWEDSLVNLQEDGWTSLLAPFTGQAFLGGLDPECRMEHFYARLLDGRLAGKDIRLWSDQQLDQFFNRYNVGRVVVRTEASIERFRNYPAAREENTDKLAFKIFTLNREHNFFLKGKGKLIEATWKRIELSDVQPEDGEVILSMHYQQGWVLSPQVGEVERQLDAEDPIPFIRLWLSSPVPHLVLEWRGP
ncbi:hypothetical protein KIH39_13530 [Telmatocola sphagniphila]|uniref:Uncharacterized protein n=1 Tax=Telmatocola sphagniphila TaxID=1123043 RepID=A0A8E6EW93_9BACT|nr:hypothetical protein [Telmatocola sphagniphila]QVL29891.1 hypothetical protein KIH39_13530 [Telmatocola sphagniphila]